MTWVSLPNKSYSEIIKTKYCDLYGTLGKNFCFSKGKLIKNFLFLETVSHWFTSIQIMTRETSKLQTKRDRDSSPVRSIDTVPAPKDTSINTDSIRIVIPSSDSSNSSHRYFELKLVEVTSDQPVEPQEPQYPKPGAMSFPELLKGGFADGWNF